VERIVASHATSCAPAVHVERFEPSSSTCTRRIRARATSRGAATWDRRLRVDAAGYPSGMSPPDAPPDPASDLPPIGGPARAALELAGIRRLDQLTDVTERQLLALHGVGPKAIRILRETLAARGLAFRPETTNRERPG
jgi:predicted flap endonuclease-1-like 5' DNA nuclease